MYIYMATSLYSHCIIPACTGVKCPRWITCRLCNETEKMHTVNLNVLLKRYYEDIFFLVCPETLVTKQIPVIITVHLWSLVKVNFDTA